VVDSAPLIGWAGLKNGELLAHVDGQYDVFLTMDANLSYDQYLATLRIAGVVLKAETTDLPTPAH